ncbi:MAG: LOG family protein [Candidatus Omnitrophica bacterium]|nr:LOG family protein [Candidatus Omnitrophota bacterium]
MLTLVHRIDEQKGQQLLLADVWDLEHPGRIQTFGGKYENMELALPAGQLDPEAERKLLEYAEANQRTTLRAIEVAMILMPDLQIILAGSVEEDGWYDRGFSEVAQNFPEQFRYPRKFIMTYEPEYEWLYSGGTRFVMPSWFEPCGLSDEEAAAYGVPRIQSRRDGLRDKEIKLHGAHGETLFEEAFEPFNPVALLSKIFAHHDLYRNRPDLDWELRYQAIIQDNRWLRKAKNYIERYRALAEGEPITELLALEVASAIHRASIQPEVEDPADELMKAGFTSQEAVDIAVTTIGRSQNERLVGALINRHLTALARVDGATADYLQEQLLLAREHAEADVAGRYDAALEVLARSELRGKRLTSSVIREGKRAYRTMSKWDRALVAYGSARTAEGHEDYELAERSGGIAWEMGLPVRDGAGNGIMEAFMRGYAKARGNKKRGKPTQGVRILLPKDYAASINENLNRFVEDAVFFRHFIIRKLLLHVNIIGTLNFPGGFGTFDEMFEVWRRRVPTILMGSKFWNKIMPAFEESWREAGLLKKIQFPMIEDSPYRAVQYMKNIAVHQTPFVPSRDYVKRTNRELMRGYETLNAMNGRMRSIAFIGRPNRHKGHEQIEAAADLATRLVSDYDVHIRLATQGALFDRLYYDSIGNDWDERLQAVLYRNPHAQYFPGEAYAMAKRGTGVILNNPSNHQFLLGMRVSAFVFLPGGIGTMNKLFDYLTLMQTKQIPRKPIILIGRKFWTRIFNAIKEAMLDDEELRSVINPEDLKLIRIVNTAEEAYNALSEELDDLGLVLPRSETRTPANPQPQDAAGERELLRLYGEVPQERVNARLHELEMRVLRHPRARVAQLRQIGDLKPNDIIFRKDVLPRNEKQTDNSLIWPMLWKVAAVSGDTVSLVPLNEPLRDRFLTEGQPEDYTLKDCNQMVRGKYWHRLVLPEAARSELRAPALKVNPPVFSPSASAERSVPKPLAFQIRKMQSRSGNVRGAATILMDVREITGRSESRADFSYAQYAEAFQMAAFSNNMRFVFYNDDMDMSHPRRSELRNLKGAVFTPDGMEAAYLKYAVADKRAVFHISKQGIGADRIRELRDRLRGRKVEFYRYLSGEKRPGLMLLGSIVAQSGRFAGLAEDEDGYLYPTDPSIMGVMQDLLNQYVFEAVESSA